MMLFPERHRAGQRWISRHLLTVKEWLRPHYLRWLYFRLKPENCPRPFRDCWRFPADGIDAFHEKLDPQISDFDDLVFLPMADWHSGMQRSQHLASALASSGHRCYYVNPHLGREFLTSYLRSPRVLVSTLGPRIRELHVHLWQEPVFHHRCLHADENAFVAESIDTVLRRASSRGITLIVSFPVWGDVAAQLRDRWNCKIVYDCHDLLSGFGDVSADVLDAERALFASSDLIVFSAQWLMDKQIAEHPDVASKSLLLRNGVTASDFLPAFEQRCERSAADTPKTVGYVGSMESWFDVETVKYAALARPNWRFVLIGRVGSGKLSSLKSLPNVSFPGYVPYENLPSHLSQMDVAIIPFVRSPLTLATNPVKLYEYFACGLPVVSRRLPELEQYSGLVHFAESPQEFVAQIEDALDNDGPELRARRRDAVLCESWTARCTTLKGAMQVLQQRSTAVEVPAVPLAVGSTQP